jgi:hypothetical protein
MTLRDIFFEIALSKLNRGLHAGQRNGLEALLSRRRAQRVKS